MARLLLPVLLVGCSYPEDTFRDDLDAAACDWKTDCFSYQDYADCLTEARESREPVPSSCTYDPAAARECVQDYSAVDCPLQDDLTDQAAVPLACQLVWECP